MMKNLSVSPVCRGLSASALINEYIWEKEKTIMPPTPSKTSPYEKRSKEKEWYRR